MADLLSIKVPDIGDSDGVEVIEVLVAVGDSVGAEDSLITLESDKATMEIPAPVAGVIRSLSVAVGDQVAEGAMVAELEPAEEALSSDTPAEADNDEPAEPEPAAAQPPAPAPAPAPKPAQPSPPMGAEPPATGTLAYASPSIRRFARELGVDLNKVSGTGRKGRILKEDVKGFIKGVMSGSGAVASSGLTIAPPPKVNFEKFGEIEVEPLTRIQKISGPSLHRNWVTIPHVTQNDDADVTDMEAFRKANKEDALKDGIRLTPIAFLMKACVRALRKFPQFNSSLSADGESLVLKKYFHIGVAVDTPNGLVVPVIRDCDQKGLLDLAKELGEVSGRARDGKLMPKDLQGGCFSISSLGGIGGTGFTPIINAPEVAILGASRTAMKPVWNGKEFEPRLMMPLSLSYDHRVIDGAAAARFTRYLADLLGDLRRVML